MKNSDALYLHLFHGRKTPDEHLDDWGLEGPIIGPVTISWTYGNLKLHPATYADSGIEFMPMFNDLVIFEGIYYGDIAFLTKEEVDAMKDKPRIISFKEFEEIVRNKIPETYNL